MFYTVYQITNIVNQKIYVGIHITTNLNDGYLGSGKLIRKAVQKYGIEKFSKEILYIFDNEDDMLRKEAEIVTSEFCLRSDTYNLTNGGFGGFSYINRSGIAKFRGKQHTDETKRKISEHMRGNRNSAGTVFSDEIKKKIGDNTRQALSGKSKSSDHKKRISEALKARYADGEILNQSRDHMAFVRSRKPELVSDTTKSKISESLKLAWASGNRKRVERDWQSIQEDLNTGLPRKDIYQKYQINRNILDNAFKMQYVKRNN